MLSKHIAIASSSAVSKCWPISYWSAVAACIVNGVSIIRGGSSSVSAASSIIVFFLISYFSWESFRASRSTGSPFKNSSSGRYLMIKSTCDSTNKFTYRLLSEGIVAKEVTAYSKSAISIFERLRLAIECHEVKSGGSWVNKLLERFSSSKFENRAITSTN